MSGRRKRMKIKPIQEKLLINIGCLFDIPTCTFIKGERGETIINGGLDLITAVVGPGNSFKSTILHYMSLSAANTINATHDTTIDTYDTEMNIKLDRLRELAKRFPHLNSDPLDEDEGEWVVTDKTEYYGDEWLSIVKEHTKELEKDKPVAWSAMLGDKRYMGHVPTFIEVDSLSAFEAKTTTTLLEKAMEKNDMDSINMINMNRGKFKSNVISDMPATASKAGVRFLTTAHIGVKIDMDGNKYNKPSKPLQYMKEGEILKGIAPNALYLFSNIWYATTASVLKNQTTKLPEYPLAKDEANVATDLNLVRLTSMRSKSGASGIILPIVVSQVEGVLPTLTEFHFIKENGRFALGGNNINYHITFAPDIKLSRAGVTAVRTKIDKIKKVRRAINIASELLQLKIFKPSVVRSGLWCEPEELYNDLISMGYDWDELLDTRGYATIDNYAEDLPHFLSIMDLLFMRKNQYVPYWMKDKKKKEKK